MITQNHSRLTDSQIIFITATSQVCRWILDSGKACSHEATRWDSLFALGRAVEIELLGASVAVLYVNLRRRWHRS